MTNYQMLVDAIESLQKQQDELREKVIRHEDLLNQQQIKISNLQNENKILRTNNTDLKKKLVNVFKEHRIQKQQLKIIEESVNRNNRALTETFTTSTHNSFMGTKNMHSLPSSIWYLDKEYIKKYYLDTFISIEYIIRCNSHNFHYIYIKNLIGVFQTYKFKTNFTDYYCGFGGNYTVNKNIYPDRTTVINLNLLEMFICYNKEYNFIIYCYSINMSEADKNKFILFDKIVSMFMDNKFTIKKEVIENLFIDSNTYYNIEFKDYKKGTPPNDLETMKQKKIEHLRAFIKYITDRIKVVDDN